MTVAIGMYSIGGLIVCADTNIVSQDGMVIPGSKIKALEASASYVIANASDDGNAATMLADGILDELSKSFYGNMESVIKEKMKEWHSGYSKGNQPPMQFIIAALVGPQTRSLYFCEPPNTVLRKHLNEQVVIGVGAPTIEPLFSQVILGPTGLRANLLRAAYLMYCAKKEHIFLKGSQTDTMVISDQTREVYVLTREEMEDAEKIGPDIDFLLRYCYLGVLGQDPPNIQLQFLKGFRRKYLATVRKAQALQFPSLAGLI